MAEALVARQPILDDHLRLIGYELLFRSGPVNRAEVLDSEGASAIVALNSLTEFGIEQLTGGHDAWINVSRDFVLAEFAELLPSRHFVLEFLEGQVIDRLVVEKLRELHRAGYRIALDDFEYEAAAAPLLEFVDFVKLDIQALGRDRFSEQVAMLSGWHGQIVAEKVETEEERQFCSGFGCRLFQGYFFAKPQMVSRNRVETGRAGLLQLLFALSDPACDLTNVQRAISSDPSLTYRLLRYMESAQFGFHCQIRSVAQAVALLGAKQLQRWAALSLFLMVDGKSSELTRLALTRARFCELAARGDTTLGPNEMFMAGLMSVLDALLDEPIEQAVHEVPLAPEIIDAILGSDNQPGSDKLSAIRALEQGDIDAAEALIPAASPLYVESLAWVDGTSGAFAM